MINNFQDFQRLGQTNVDSAMRMFGDWNKGWQAITSEMTDYSKRAFQDGQATFEKLINAKTMEQIMEIQTSYARRSYEGYMQQLTKMGSMYSSYGQEAYKPVARAVQSVQSVQPVQPVQSAQAMR